MLRFRIVIDTEAALVAGKSTVGEVDVEWGDEEVGKLTEPQRRELARAVGEPLGTRIDDLPLKDQVLETIAAGLQHRVDARLAREAGERRETEAAAAAARATAEAEKTRKQEDDAKEAQRVAALQKWVIQHGDTNQKARHKEGLLPEREILESVRDQLFDELDTHEQLTRPTVADACACACAGEAKVTVSNPKGMTAEQYNRLVDIREDAPRGAKVNPIIVEARCHGGCDCKPVAVIGAAVEVAWNGFTLTREYAL